MADVIARLKLESGEYDSKIKRATDGLRQMEQECRKVGGTLAVLEDDQRKFVQSLGQMDTVSHTVRGSLNELKQAFTELSAQYNRLTDEEKNGDFGKALSQSLDQLKARIREGNNELGNINREINGGSGLKNSLEGLASKFGLNIAQLTKFGSGIGLATTALKVAKDAFLASEANVDEWGRVVAASQSAYEGFLTAINNGDVSGYLTRIDDIVTAARTAYNEIDRLGTMKTIQSPKMQEQMTENERFRMMIQTGRYIAPMDGRKSSMKDGQLLTADQIRTLEKQLQGGLGKVVGLIGNEVKQTRTAINAFYNKLAKENGMTMAEFLKGTSSISEFEKRVEGAKRYEDFEARRRAAESWARAGHNLTFEQAALIGARNPDEQYKGWTTFRVDKQGEGSYNELVNLIKQGYQQMSQSYGMQSQVYRTINRAEGTTVRDIMKGGKSGTGGGDKTTKTGITYVADSIAAQEQVVSDLTKKWKEASDAVRDDYAEALDYAQQKLLAMKGGFDPTSIRPIMDMTGTSLLQTRPDFTRGTAPIAPDQIVLSDALQKMMDRYNGKDDGKDKKEDDKEFSKIMSGLTGGVSSIVSGIESLGIEIPEDLRNIMSGIQSTMSIVQGIASILLVIEALNKTQTAVSFIPFSTGGIVHAAGGVVVPGRNYSNDMVPAMLNSGELVLNKAEQGIVANALQNGGGGQVYVTGMLKGEDLMIAIDRTARRKGMGELVFWK